MDLLNIREKLEDYFVLTTDKTSQWETWLSELTNYNNGRLEFNGFIDYDPLDVVLTVDKKIISYTHNDTVVLTAKVYDTNEDPIPNYTVTFNLNGISIGTSNTNNEGVAVKTYNSQGIGDITFTAKASNIISNQILIEDCIDYEPLTSNKDADKWVIDENLSVTYNDNGFRFGFGENVTITNRLTYIPTFNRSISLEFTLTDYEVGERASTGAGLYFRITSNGSTPTSNIITAFNTGKTRVVNCNTFDYSFVKGATYRIEYTPSTTSLYEGNKLLGTCTSRSEFPIQLEFNPTRYVYMSLKDFKIKPVEYEAEIDSITLTTDVNLISSHTDNVYNSADLTATVLDDSENGIVGQTVKVYEGNKLLGNMIDNDDGTYSYTLTSNGHGTRVINAKVDEIISDTVTIEDYYYYDLYSNTGAEFNQIVCEVDKEFSCTYDIYASDYYNWNYIEMNDTYDDNYGVAVLSTSSNNSGSYPIKTTNFPVQNTWTNILLTFKEGVFSIYSNGVLKGTTTMPDLYFDNYGILTIINSKSSTKIRNVQIKPIQTLFNPSLNGEDEITSWTTMTNTTSDGVYTTHGSFLTTGWSNEGLWELDFDCQGSYSSSNKYYYVGLMPVCSADINPFTDAERDNYAITTWEGFTYPNGLGKSSWDSEDIFTKINDGNWHHMKITKLTSTKLKIVLDNASTAIGDFPNLANLSTLHIGSRDNPTSRNTGALILLKNIIVTTI